MNKDSTLIRESDSTWATETSDLRSYSIFDIKLCRTAIEANDMRLVQLGKIEPNITVETDHGSLNEEPSLHSTIRMGRWNNLQASFGSLHVHTQHLKGGVS
jgi:hypothetical protein